MNWVDMRWDVLQAGGVRAIDIGPQGPCLVNLWPGHVTTWPFLVVGIYSWNCRFGGLCPSACCNFDYEVLPCNIISFSFCLQTLLIKFRQGPAAVRTQVLQAVILFIQFEFYFCIMVSRYFVQHFWRNLVNFVDFFWYVVSIGSCLAMAALAVQMSLEDWSRAGVVQWLG